MARRLRKSNAGTRAADSEAEERQQHLQEGVDADHAPVSAGAERNRLGGDRHQPSGPDQYRRKILADRYGEAHRASDENGPRQYRQANGEQGCPWPLAEPGGNRLVTRVEGAPGRGQATGRRRAGRRPYEPAPAPPRWRRRRYGVRNSLRPKTKPACGTSKRQVKEEQRPAVAGAPASGARARGFRLQSAQTRPVEARPTVIVVQSGSAICGMARIQPRSVSVSGKTFGNCQRPDTDQRASTARPPKTIIAVRTIRAEREMPDGAVCVEAAAPGRKDASPRCARASPEAAR